MDILSSNQRSANMSCIRSKNTKPELIVRRLTHSLGFRFRLHRRDLPGTPDLVFPRLEKIIFVHGCFWHRHRGCKYAYSPKSNKKFWKGKLDANLVRDKHSVKKLQKLGWKVLVVWECETKHHTSLRQQIFEFLS